MKIYHWLLPALSLFPASAAAQMAGYEYWTDGNDTQRTYVEQTQGSVGIEIDVEDLRPGIHRFHFRACDAQGRWSSPFCRYFLRLGKAYDGTGMATCEHAIDGGEWAEAALVDGRLDLELPVSGLVPGVHRLMLRFADEAGRWTGIMTRNFVRLGPDYSSNTLRSYECWIDGDYAAWVEGTAEGGMVELEFPTSDLSYGLHRVSFRSRDEAGRWSAPFSRYFVKAEPSLADNRIEAYEYWFNNGKTTRVEVTPANPFAADDIWLDVEGVVPHEIPEDYTVDWETCTAYSRTTWYSPCVSAIPPGVGRRRVPTRLPMTFRWHWISAPWFTVIRSWSCSPVLAGFMLTKSRRRPVTRWSGERMPLAGWTSMAKTGHGFTV